MNDGVTKNLTPCFACSSSEKLKKNDVSHDLSTKVIIVGVVRKAINKIK
jgi:hypothetical protein